MNKLIGSRKEKMLDILSEMVGHTIGRVRQKEWEEIEPVSKAIRRLIKNMDKKPKMSREFLEKIRDRLMAIPIKEYYAPNRRKAILDEMIKVFIENGLEVEEEKEG